MATPSDSDSWDARKDRIIGLGERSFRKSYYPQLRQNLDRLERFRTLLDRTSDFVILVAMPDGMVVDANAALGRLFGESVEDLIGRSFASLGLADATTVLDGLRREMVARADGGEMLTHTLVTEFGPENSTIWLELTYRVAKVDEGCFGVLVGRDITERKHAEDKVNFLAHHDALTRLPNLLLLQDRLNQAIAFADRGTMKLALMVIDLDRFKTINDSLGHGVGDRLLVEVSKRLSSCTRDTDTVCRQGGDEFLIMLPNLADADFSVTFLGSLMSQMGKPFGIEGKELLTSVSIGVAIYPDDGTDLETLQKKAEMAMYRAKEAGRNTYRFFNEEMNGDAVERLSIDVGLRRGLELGQFELYYQPQIEIASGALIAAEALIRWNHPELGLVLPGRFISVAEDSGLIVPLGDWVLREACREAMRWQQSGQIGPVVAVNLSALQFKRGDIETSVTQALEQSGLDPGRLELELTESILIDDTENVLATVKRLKLMGVQLSIDDFGTGYSSLSYLKRFEVDKLKIDQSFIRDLATDPEDAAIVRAVIQMARSLGLRTIAEGVESKQVLDHLRIYHCDEAQGFFHGRPMPAEAFRVFIASHVAGRAPA
jgi:diguanylate cyclase (GGDEF)-like protein/PAS domain S-box-containing protein